MLEMINEVILNVHGASGHSGGVANSVEQLLVFLVSLTEKTPSEIFTLIMPGISAMENIHPLFVHFPIALLTNFVLIDLLGSLFNKPSWRIVAGWFLYVGVIMTAATVAAGLAAEKSVVHGGNVHDIMERHEALALTVFALTVLLAAWRIVVRGRLSGGTNIVYLGLAILMNIILIFTADMGGLMVYKYGVSVKAAQTVNQRLFNEHQHGDHDHSHGHEHSH
jgi:uncharacterized membrane protein